MSAGNNGIEKVLEQLRHQARQLEISAQVSRQLTAALDLDELLLKVVELIKSSFDYYHVHVYLLDAESGYLIMREGTGEIGRKLKARDHRIPLGRGMVGTVGESGQPLLARDVREQPSWIPNPLLPETRSELTVPLKIGDRVLGVLDVQSNQVGGLTEADLSLMESLGQQIAVAVQNALLFRETRAVSIISRAVSSGLGMDRVFSAVSRELKEVVDFDYMTIAVYYEIADQVEIVGVEDRTAADIPLEEGVQLPLDLCIPGMAMRRGRPVIAPDLTAPPFDSFIDAEILLKRGMHSVLSVPLILRGQAVGAVSLASAKERAFTSADAHLMEQISGQLATALENAQVFENIQQMVSERTAEVAVFRAMVDNALEAIALADEQQLITYVNAAFYRVHRYDPEKDKLLRRPLVSFIAADDQDALSEDIRAHVLRGDVWRGEVYHHRRDGTRFLSSTTIFGVRDEAGELMATAALIRDISAERKIVDISRAASSTPDLGRLAPLVLEHIAADTDIDRVVLILYDKITEEGPQTMSVVAVYDPETGGKRITDESLTAQDSPFTTVVYHERRAVFVADVRTDERLFEKGRAMLLEHGILSMLALPIMVRDKVVGAVIIDWRKHVELGEDEIELYQTMVNQVSTAVENARLIAMQQRELEEALDRRVREVATSTEVGQAIAAAPELEELFHRVVTLIKERFGYYHAHVYQLNKERNVLEMRAGYGEPGRIMKERGHSIPVGKGLVGTAAATGEPVRAENVFEQPNWLPNPLLPDTKSELAVPIKLGDEVLGVLDVQSDRIGGLTEDDELLLLGLCGQIAVSIQNAQILAQARQALQERTREAERYQALAERNAQLLEEVQRSQAAAQRRAHQLELSAGVSEQLASTLELRELLSAVVNLIQSGFDYYHVHVYLLDEENGELVMMEGTGDAGQVMKERGHRIPVGKGLVGLAAQTGETVLAPDVSKRDDWLPNPLLPETKSEMAVPFKLAGKVVGVLDVQSDEVNGLTEEDQALLEGLGGQIAIAVQNARLFAEIERQVEERTREVRVFQALAENAADAVAMADLEGYISYVNPAWHGLYGYDPDQRVAGTPVSEFWPPEAVQWMEQAIQQPTYREWRGEMIRTRPDGSQVIVELTLFVVRDDEGNPVSVAALGRDITADRLADRLTELAGKAASLVEFGTSILGEVVQSIDVDAGSFLLYPYEQDREIESVTIVSHYERGALEPVVLNEPHAVNGDSPCVKAYHSRSPLVYDDLSKLDDALRIPLQERGVKAVAVCPLVTSEGRVVGALSLERRRHMPFASEVRLLGAVLERTSLALSNLIYREARRRETEAMLRRRTLEVHTTTEVAQAIASATELEDLFQRVVTLVKERFGYYHVHVYRLDPERGDLEMAAGYGEPGRIMKERGHRIPMGKGLVGTAARTGQPVLVPDVSKRDDWLPNPLLPDTRSELAVPIMMGDEVLGVLDVQNDRVGGVTEDDQLLLLNLCGQIATAIQNTRLLQETQASLRQTDLLLNLSTALSTLTDPREIAETLVQQVIGIADVERCTVGIYQDYDEDEFPERVQIYAVSRRGAVEDRIKPGSVYDLSDYPAMFEHVVKGGEMMVIEDIRHDERLSESERAIFELGGTSSVVIVPMSSAERVLGYLSIEAVQPQKFAEDELELYQGIANQSAIALSNALLLSEIRDTLEEVNALYEASQSIATATTHEALVQVIIQQLASTNIDRCDILLYERREGQEIRYLEVVGSWAAGGDAMRAGERIRLRDYPWTQLARALQRDALIISTDDLARWPEAIGDRFADRGIMALVLVPLMAAEEPIGFIAIERHETSSFSAEAIRFYETLASQSAVALRNLQLIELSQSQLRELQKSYQDVARLADTVRQLSSPVIQVWEDVLVLPLVGAIDSRRAMRIMEDLLTGITRYQAEQVIIDITGVPVIDTSVANYLLQTIKAASLLGARCMLVGISAEMAQTIVGLGLDLRDITTYSNLRAGIQAALQRTGFAITPLSPVEGEKAV